MLVAAAFSFAAYFGAFGTDMKTLSAFLSLGIALVLPPVVAWATKGKYYIARDSEPRRRRGHPHLRQVRRDVRPDRHGGLPVPRAARSARCAAAPTAAATTCASPTARPWPGRALSSRWTCRGCANWRRKAHDRAHHHRGRPGTAGRRDDRGGAAAPGQRPGRQARPAARRVPDPVRRRGRGGRRAGRPGAGGRPGPRAAARDPAGGEGHPGHPGVGDHRAEPGARPGLVAGRRRPGGVAAAGGGRGHHRQDHDHGVRHRPARPGQAVPGAAQPVGPGHLARRFELGHRGRGGGRDVPRRARHRHRRQHPHPGGVLRHHRHEAHLRPGAAGRLPAARLQPRPHRADGPQRHGLRGHAVGDGRPRPARPGDAAVRRRHRAGRPGGGLRGRADRRPVRASGRGRTVDPGHGTVLRPRRAARARRRRGRAGGGGRRGHRGGDSRLPRPGRRGPGHHVRRGVQLPPHRHARAVDRLRALHPGVRRPGRAAVRRATT